MKFKIAVVQFKIITHDPEANLRRMELFIKKAGTAGADIVVFPEGVTAKNMAVRRDLADRKQFYVNRIREMVRRNKVDAVFSLDWLFSLAKGGASVEYTISVPVRLDVVPSRPV